MNAEGINKAALLLMSLGENEASEAFRFLDPREVEKISIAIATLKNVTHGAVDAVLQDFIKEAVSHTTLSLDSKEYIRSVLTSALGEERAGGIIDRIMLGDDVTGIEGLKWMDAPTVAELIMNEHPQIIATILVHLDPDQASDVLACFTERTRNDVLLRIATLDGIQPAALRELDDVMTDLLSGNANVKRKAVGGVRAAAEILNHLSNQHEESVIESVRGYDVDLAQKIIDEMFTFDKLVELDDRAIRLLLRGVGTETLVIALKVGPPELRQKFMANMSQRAAELFSDDMETSGPVRLSEVEAKQRIVLQVARNLADSGEIALGDKADDMYV
ncbi:flagellar motor switch protein FliG [Paraburkholderia xenovorans]|uniref:flagellar motor switch protein FliG n=1 Tax=Paraburkholderia xenovorans TaxID=36873 RepID=UPI0038B95422